MIQRLLLVVLLIAGFIVCRSNAAVREAIITWTGSAGYRARIDMSFDDTFAYVGAWGGGAPIAGIPTNQGITQLSVAFFSPSLQPLFATNDISGGLISYRFLTISFDTRALTLFGSLDVGKDSFAEEEPGSSAGQYYLTGVSSPTLYDSFLAQSVDSGGQFRVTVVPEPSIWSFCIAATVVFIGSYKLAQPRSFTRRLDYVCVSRRKLPIRCQSCASLGGVIP